MDFNEKSRLKEIIIVKARIFALEFLVLITSVLLFTSCNVQNASIGKPAPSFKLPDLKGNIISLDQYKGKIVLLDFWATWCNPCRMTMPLMEKLQKEYSESVVLLAINLQEPEEDVRNFAYQQNIHSQILLDAKGSLGDPYQIGSIPMFVLIDKTGIVRRIEPGFNPTTTIEEFRAEIEKMRSK
jgi:thiol-disulfide isomerase/thioredoxin